MYITIDVIHAKLIVMAIVDTPLPNFVEMTKTLLEMSAEVVKRGIKTSVFWCGPLPILAIFGADDIQVTFLNWFINSFHRQETNCV